MTNKELLNGLIMDFNTAIDNDYPTLNGIVDKKDKLSVSEFSIQLEKLKIGLTLKAGEMELFKLESEVINESEAENAYNAGYGIIVRNTFFQGLSDLIISTKELKDER